MGLDRAPISSFCSFNPRRAVRTEKENRHGWRNEQQMSQAVSLFERQAWLQFTDPLEVSETWSRGL